MTTYDYIVNPNTGKKVSLNTQLGLNILEQYTNKLEGGGLKDIKEWFRRRLAKKEKEISPTQIIMNAIADDREKKRIILILIKTIPKEILHNIRRLNTGRKIIIAHNYYGFNNTSNLEELRNIAEKHHINLDAKKMSRSTDKESGAAALKRSLKDMETNDSINLTRQVEQRKIDRIERKYRGPISSYNVSRAKTIRSKPLEKEGHWIGE